VRNFRVSSLKKGGDFKRVFERGKNVAAPLLVVYALANDLGFNRLGLSVSKKVGGAVIRNRVRRLIKESYRLIFTSAAAAQAARPLFSNDEQRQQVQQPVLAPPGKGVTPPSQTNNLIGGVISGYTLANEVSASFDLIVIARVPAGKLAREGAFIKISDTLSRLFKRLNVLT